MKLLLAIVFACYFIAVFGEKARYDNYRLYSVEIRNDGQLEILKDLDVNHDGINFLGTPNKVPQSVDIIVPPHKFALVSELFQKYHVKHSIKNNNLQESIDSEQPVERRSDFSWDQYNDLPAFDKWIDELLERYPDVLTEYVYGRSYENRPLRAVKVSHKKGNPAIFIESTIHAREWIAPASASYLLNELLNSNDADMRNLANSYDWVIVLIVNADGYDYTHRKDRMWRKNRTPSESNPLCIGVDLNRTGTSIMEVGLTSHTSTFERFINVGSSSQPCAETYAGPRAFSEPETLALSKFISTIDNLKLYMSFHSYSQLLLFPYGHTTDHANNHADLDQVGRATVQAIARRYGTQYVSGTIAETIYLASGSSIDWVYGTQNVSLTFTFEFRDKGRHGFILPADQIIPNSLEFIDGLKAMIEEARSLHYL